MMENNIRSYSIFIANCHQQKDQAASKLNLQRNWEGMQTVVSKEKYNLCWGDEDIKYWQKITK